MFQDYPYKTKRPSGLFFLCLTIKKLSDIFIETRQT
jgi:hypothetical protein